MSKKVYKDYFCEDCGEDFVTDIQNPSCTNCGSDNVSLEM